MIQSRESGKFILRQWEHCRGSEAFNFPSSSFRLQKTREKGFAVISGTNSNTLQTLLAHFNLYSDVEYYFNLY